MSTIHHRPVHLNLWWYVAAAVLAGAVLALILATLQFTGSAAVVQTDTTGSTPSGSFKPNPYVCRAGHPVPNIELPGCISPVG
jgi:hypothetical protein